MDMETALKWSDDRRTAVLVTLRRDGRPQSSDVAYNVHNGCFSISLTNDRAKTANMRRDSRVVLHITEPSSWSYLSFDGSVALTPVTTAVTDETNNALVAYYLAVSGEHPNWNEYRQAMVDEGRLLAHFTPTSVVGQVH